MFDCASGVLRLQVLWEGNLACGPEQRAVEREGCDAVSRIPRWDERQSVHCRDADSIVMLCDCVMPRSCRDGGV